MFESAPILSALAPVDTRNPLNRAHPLNRGLLAWWLCVPGLVGGSNFYDLMGLHPASLANMTSVSVSGWKGTTRPGGFGHLLFDGVDDQATCNSTAALNPSNITLCAWINTTGAANGSPTKQSPSIIRKESSYTITLNAGSPDQFLMGIFAGSNATVTAPSNNTWHHVAGTFDGSNLRLFIDGNLAATQANTNAIPSTTNAVAIGYGAAFSNEHFPGAMDDLRIWGRALSTAEIRSYYTLSRQGYPGVLNRVPWWSYPKSSTSGLLLRRRRMAVA